MRAADIGDLDIVERLSGGRVDLTYGRCVVAFSCPSVLLNFNCSSLDIFGGKLVKFENLVVRNARSK